MRKLLTALLLFAFTILLAQPAQANWVVNLYNNYKQVQKDKSEGKNPWLHIKDPVKFEKAWGIRVPEYYDKLRNEQPNKKLKDLLSKEGLQKLVVYQDMLEQVKNFKQLKLVRNHLKRYGIDKYGDKLSPLHKQLYELINKEVIEEAPEMIKPPIVQFFQDKKKEFRGTTDQEMVYYKIHYKEFFPKPRSKLGLMMLPILGTIAVKILTRGML